MRRSSIEEQERGGTDQAAPFGRDKTNTTEEVPLMLTKTPPRQDEAQTHPAPMDTVRSMLADVEAAATRGDGQAVDQGFDEAINALMAMQERYKREAGTWAPAADTQSSSVLDAELPDLPNPELVMRIQAEGLLPTLRRA